VREGEGWMLRRQGWRCMKKTTLSGLGLGRVRVRVRVRVWVWVWVRFRVRDRDRIRVRDRVGRAWLKERPEWRWHVMMCHLF
jgi:hypothetical protein